MGALGPHTLDIILRHCQLQLQTWVFVMRLIADESHFFCWAQGFLIWSCCWCFLSLTRVLQLEPHPMVASFSWLWVWSGLPEMLAHEFLNFSRLWCWKMPQTLCISPRPCRGQDRGITMHICPNTAPSSKYGNFWLQPTAVCQIEFFKMVVHKQMGDVTVALHFNRFTTVEPCLNSVHVFSQLFLHCCYSLPGTWILLI